VGPNSKVARNAEALAVTHKGWLCQLSWEQLAESRQQSQRAREKNNQPKGMKGDEFLTNHTFSAMLTNGAQEIHLFF